MSGHLERQHVKATARCIHTSELEVSPERPHGRNGSDDMPLYVPIRTKTGYAVYSFTTGVVYPHREATDMKYLSAKRNPDRAFDQACEQGDMALALWILEHLIH